MNTADLFRLIGLSAIWGSSFLFLRIAAPAFGPIPLIMIRIVGAALCLTPFLLERKVREGIRNNAGHLFVLGLFNSAIPFCLLAYAALSLEAGFASLLNATTPIFAALVGWAWMGYSLRASQIFGLLIGVGGVLILVWGKLSFREGGLGWAIAAALLATSSYGIAVHYTKRFLGQVSSRVATAGSLSGASLLILPLGIWFWPEGNPTWLPWMSAFALAALCTAFAYVIFFRIIATAGGTNASTVTFIVPGFAIVWGALFLGESITPRIVVGMIVTLIGTAYTTGLIGYKNSKPQESEAKER